MAGQVAGFAELPSGVFLQRQQQDIRAGRALRAVQQPPQPAGQSHSRPGGTTAPPHPAPLAGTLRRHHQRHQLPGVCPPRTEGPNQPVSLQPGSGRCLLSSADLLCQRLEHLGLGEHGLGGLLARETREHSAGADAGFTDHLQLDDADHLRGEVHLRCVALLGQEVFKDQVGTHCQNAGKRLCTQTFNIQ